MPDERCFYRPVPALDGLPLAGTGIRFREVRLLRRGRAAEMADAGVVPADLLARLTSARSDLAGVSLDRPRVMGIINVTPDSFSDGGLWSDPAVAIAHGRELAGEGADFLDIGGESTRPGATELEAQAECARVLPVVGALHGLAPVSIDTRKAAVAQAACAAGAVIVNDVTALAFDPEMARVVAELAVPVVLMRPPLPSQLAPADPNPGGAPDGAAHDIVLDVYEALEGAIATAEAAGIPRRQIVADPGIGFSQSTADNLALLRNISVFHGLGCALLLGASRKNFIGVVSGAHPASARDPGSIAATLAAAAQGVQIHRVHDVAATVQAMAVWREVTRG